MTSRAAQLRTRKMAAQAGRCFYCEQAMWQGDDAAFRRAFRLSRRRARFFQATAEHLVARSAGGPTNAANIVAACWFCNQTRHRAKQPKCPEGYKTHVRRRMARGGWQQLAPA